MRTQKYQRFVLELITSDQLMIIINCLCVLSKCMIAGISIHIWARWQLSQYSCIIYAVAFKRYLIMRGKDCRMQHHAGQQPLIAISINWYYVVSYKIILYYEIDQLAQEFFSRCFCCCAALSFDQFSLHKVMHFYVIYLIFLQS